MLVEYNRNMKVQINDRKKWYTTGAFVGLFFNNMW
jgi:hypothetical protein